MRTTVSTPSRAVTISDDGPTVVIGERINPTARKKLGEALLEGNLGMVRDEALRQVQAGAHILDVNVGYPGVDEPAMIREAVRAVMESEVCRMTWDALLIFEFTLLRFSSFSFPDEMISSRERDVLLRESACFEAPSTKCWLTSENWNEASDTCLMLRTMPSVISSIRFFVDLEVRSPRSTAMVNATTPILI